MARSPSTNRPDSPVVRPGVSLRTAVAVITTAIVLVSLADSLTLVYATTRLQRTTQELGAGVESVRLSHDIGIDLLLHGRSQDAVVRHDLADSLRRRLADADVFVSSPGERRRLDAAVRHVEAYLASGTSDDHAAAYSSVLALIDTNVTDARHAVERAARLDRTSNLLGFAAIVILLVTVGALLLWLQRHVVRPMTALADIMSSFGEGRRDARAKVQGPTEVVAIATQFNAMADSLESERRSRIALLGGVAHDLRGPLSAMNLSVASMRIGALSPERSEAIAARLDRLLGRVERMVNDFLDATRVEAGQLRVELRPCDLRSVIAEVVDQVRASTSAHQLRAELPDVPLLVQGDALRLEQALSNLVGNAIKYSPNGGEVAVHARHEPGAVVVEVRDQGIGISDRDRASLFEPFRRLESASAIPGTGLGLFVTRGIVEAHGGTIDVDGAPRGGTVVRLRLPAGDSRELGPPA